MKVRSLQEAAADVLARSRAEGSKEPMHTMDKTIVDLGGASYENPQGTAVGKITADHRTAATAPGKSVQDNGQPPKKIEGEEGQKSHGEETSPDEENGKRAADHGSYAHPTNEESTETTASDEIIEEETSELTAEELEAARTAKVEMMKEKMKEVSFNEDIDAIFSGQTLSEEFKTKVTTIFEAAVISRALVVAEELEKEILAAAEEAVEEIHSTIEEQVDSYLNYMVEEWVKNNQVAIESGLKAEMVEDFMVGLKNLFTEHYVDIPADKVDVVESLSATVEELTAKLNESINSNVELTKKLGESKKVSILNTVCEGLTATQIEKVKTLAESVEFTTESEYTSKLKIIRENYFKSGNGSASTATKSQIALSESEGVVIEEEKVINPEMDVYVKAISRTVIK